MKNHLFLGIALALAALAPAAARAQYVNGNLQAYEAASENRWMAQRAAYYGPMGPARQELHNLRDDVDTAVHRVKQLTGNPDLGYYTRYDTRKLGILGPYPTAIAGSASAVAPVMVSQPVYGGAALNQTGGARFPTRLNPTTHLHW